ncbi:hypothetical protein [Natronoflexus pectinivorans]|uniref:Uncharacterized protein n=1 Tax=Natronoflexus pectinivorans TaxID=682526 RepID=A0A4R2GP14_9BACT|nr:hypothetical protein [Natronoflexus pectinivorans]TCO11053.1 hypothetical protein EV194_101687 [Natronoflexus pectinivorans]
MNKEYLQNSARKLKQAAPSAAVEYYNLSDRLSSEVSRLLLSRSDISELVGKENLEMMKDNHANHARFISAQLQNFNSEVLVNTLLWVFRAYRSRGFKENYWAAQLNCWVTVLKKELTEKSFEEVLPLYNWMIVNIPHLSSLTDPKNGN